MACLGLLSENSHHSRARASFSRNRFFDSAWIFAPFSLQKTSIFCFKIMDFFGLFWLLAWSGLPWPLLASPWPPLGLSLAAPCFPLPSLGLPFGLPWPPFRLPLASLWPLWPPCGLPLVSLWPLWASFWPSLVSFWLLLAFLASSGLASYLKTSTAPRRDAHFLEIAFTIFGFSWVHLASPWPFLRRPLASLGLLLASLSVSFGLPWLPLGFPLGSLASLWLPAGLLLASLGPVLVFSGFLLASPGVSGVVWPGLPSENVHGA